MSSFEGASAAEIRAPAAACYELACDARLTPSWHRAITAVEILEQEEGGRASLGRARIDALLTTLEVDLALSYTGDRQIHMSRMAGDLRRCAATWTFEELGEERTRAGFQAEFDPGRTLSLLGRGPVRARLEHLLFKQPPLGLRLAVEGRQSATLDARGENIATRAQETSDARSTDRRGSTAVD